MPPDPTLRLVAGLAEAGQRPGAAAALAAHCGVAALMLFVHDEAIDALLPAAGFPQTLPGGASWRRFLAAAQRSPTHSGTVTYPTPDDPVPAESYTEAGVTLVFVGGRCRPTAIEEIKPTLPLLAAAVRAEHQRTVASREKEAALDYAREAQALASALDAARFEIERNVRELRGRSEALEEARARAEQAVRAKDEFLAMLGHELRNPLSPILTALQILRLKQQVSREHEVIERQVASLIRLVDDLLDTSRLTQGKVQLKKELVDLADVAARAIETVSPLLEQKQQMLNLKIPAGIVLEADASRLAQVFANLLSNASKYSDRQTTILFGAERQADRVLVRVKDEGMGIPPEMLSRIFDLFVQQPQALDRAQGGLGLGLSIVRSLVHLHGGAVRAYSDGSDRGSEFVVELPAQSATLERPGRPPAAAVAATGHGQKVLVVDDNADAASMMAEALSQLGYEVRTALDGPAALRMADTFRPDAAVLDIGLPVMSGYEVAQRMRQVAGLERIVLVAVTGYGQEEDHRQAKSVGFDAHLVKPASIEALAAVLRRVDTRQPGGTPLG